MSGQRDSVSEEEEDDEIEVEAEENEEEGTDTDEGEEDGEVQDEVEDGEPKPPAKGKGRDENFAALRARSRQVEEDRVKERERAERAERELDALKRQSQQREDPQLEAERLVAMSPEERLEYGQRRLDEKLQRLEGRQQFDSWVGQDKLALREYLLDNPYLKKYGDEVEAEWQAAIQGGINLPRKVILAKVIGDRFLAGKNKVKSQQEAGKRRIERNTTRPATARGERGGRPAKDERQARYDRVKDIKL